MKRNMLAIILGCTLLINTAFASDITVTPGILNSFKTEFPSATNVKWEENDTFIMATFNEAGKELHAYYSKEGSLVVVAQFISTNDLPKSLARELKNKYNDHATVALYKMDAEGEISYFAELVKDQKKSIFRSNGSKWRMASPKE